MDEWEDWDTEERVCINCNSYFPDRMGVPTEYGFCLEDPAFEPYLDALLEDEDLEACRELIEQKKFLGTREACELFEKAHYFHIDDDSPLAHEISRMLEEKGGKQALKRIMEQFMDEGED